MNKYYRALGLSITQQTQYRLNFIISYIFSFIPLLINIFVWYAIMSSGIQIDSAFSSMGSIVIYYVTMFTINTITDSNSTVISNEIRTGSINILLVKNINYIGYHFSIDAGTRLVKLLSTVLFSTALIIFTYIYTAYKVDISISKVLITLIIVINSFLISMFLNMFINLLAFCFMKITSILGAFFLLKSLVSGLIFPLDLLPTGIYNVLSLTPFYYILYVPTIVVMDNVNTMESIKLGAMGLFWVAILFATCQILWKRGTIRYEAYGG